MTKKLKLDLVRVKKSWEIEKIFSASHNVGILVCQGQIKTFELPFFVVVVCEYFQIV